LLGSWPAYQQQICQSAGKRRVAMKSQPAGRQSHDLNRELANACFDQAGSRKPSGLFGLLPGKHPAPQVVASAASSQFDFRHNRRRYEKTRRLKAAGFRGEERLKRSPPSSSYGQSVIATVNRKFWPILKSAIAF
jgi:hypothetical protein